MLDKESSGRSDSKERFQLLALEKLVRLRAVSLGPAECVVEWLLLLGRSSESEKIERVAVLISELVEEAEDRASLMILVPAGERNLSRRSSSPGLGRFSSQSSSIF